MIRLPRPLRSWWSRRTIQFRTSAVATVVALCALGAIAHASTGFVGWLLLDSVDTDLQRRATAATSQLASGADPAALVGPDLRVLDVAGTPVDGLPAPAVGGREIDDLKAGEGVIEHRDHAEWRRWVGVVVPDPRGEPRLVLAGTPLVGYRDTLSTAGRFLVSGSILSAAAIGLATWIVVRRSLRPVERLRVAAGTLPEGERLPVPEADDELRALAEALNSMLARRDADTEWLRRFTGDAAHELRNPVSAIRVQAEVAVVHPDPEQAQEALQEIADETKRLSDLVDGLLALARAERGSQPPPRPVDLVAAVRAAADRANMRGARPRVQVETSAAALVVSASPAEVATVLDNLVSNALRYARALVRVSLLPAADSVRLLVDDDGPGIPAEHRAQVFDRFHRVEADRARSTGGSGLGLALVAEAVRRRGGTVRAGESPEGGARIEARWPLSGPLLPAVRRDDARR
ncbi:signal transduction histidine kinase [Saccharopolyspora erythraea NRRL 2338]|uniref:histidine kinase n=2 Tax=Saccharopolyspora erythraea TaxID=1836 RepID=A4F8F5_SACEN|nr:HAMP domain-containing sensor histidine kinase [Saccharopolyspora erythraea]PFG94125.1 signal transduction histidine kinase [Saccharopolyspora erythraea NRRL 2338]QRK90914.1 HAMP domain-containing histidine kinase [Saccharopolyspora erythraea]CAM00330.1 probable two-component sensor kinase [Saccharopolyspora erythraea NRRL 2338]